jgi:hypothetical protein
MVNNVEPDESNSGALLILENHMRDNPELVSDMASFLYGEGMLTGAALRTYSSAGRSASRQEGHKSQKERSMESLRIHFKPGPFEKYDLARNAKYASAIAEYNARTDKPDLTDEDIIKIEKSVINKWQLGDISKNAWKTTNFGAIKVQKINLIGQARVLEGMLETGAMEKSVFKEQYGPIVRRIQELIEQEKNLERGK